jgi:hypothetical protein
MYHGNGSGRPVDVVNDTILSLRLGWSEASRGIAGELLVRWYGKKVCTPPSDHSKDWKGRRQFRSGIGNNHHINLFR